jgi:hypothetical protein
VLVDESSMVSLKLWGALAQMKMTGNIFFVFGDCAGQFLPITDSHRAELLEGIERSRFMHSLCAGLRVEVHKYRRGTDYNHFNFVSSLYGGELSTALERAREAYPARGEAYQGTVLCVEHRCRMKVNEIANRRQAGQHKHLWVEAGKPTRGCANLPQGMFLWRGIILTAVGVDKTLKNGLRYQLSKLPSEEDANFEVQNINDRGEPVGETLSLDQERLSEILRLSHAMRYFSSQARTIVGGLRLSQTDHKHFSIRHLIVGLGRAGEGEGVEVE